MKRFVSGTFKKLISCKELILWTKIVNLRKRIKSPLALSFGSLGWKNGTEWLIENYVPSRSVGFIFGDSQDLKSFLVAQWAFNLATGISFGDLRVNKGPVVIICAEGSNSFPKRIKAIEDKHCTNVEDKIVTINRPIAMLIQNEVEMLHDLLNELKITLGESPKLLIVDTFSQCSAGINENSAGDIARYINICKEISEKHNITVLNIHHKNKEGKYRGSTALYGNVDFIMETKREKRNSFDAEEKISTKLTLTKSKDSSTNVSHMLDFSERSLDIEDNFGNTLTTLVLDEVISVQKMGSSSSNCAKDFIISSLKDSDKEYVDQSDLNDAYESKMPRLRIGTVKKNISTSCRELISEGKILEQKSGRNKAYSLIT
ncbi:MULTISPECIES: AAA family ATPase [Pseudoalteromonas]|uniref:AAA family ATPase n=1 Tax=Pseudoalteromonas TaxID=53246 RepID=UPI0028155E47|nr:AAA family ATPase [Pseudoalteromonas sp. HL-AS1]WMS90240.1 AAA family ATPase [Pseudoalteromonas sp. HL-AS1]